MQAFASWWERLFGPKSILAEPGFDPTIDPLPSGTFGNRHGSKSFPWLKIIVGLGLLAMFLIGMSHMLPAAAAAPAGPTATVTGTATATATATPPETAIPTQTAIPSLTPYATDFGGFATQATQAIPAARVTVIIVTQAPYPTEPTSTPIIIYRSGGPGAPLPTYTPYPPQQPLPTYTPQQALPTYTPLAPLHPLPTYTPQATYTPYPTYTPQAPAAPPTPAPYGLYLPLVTVQ